MRTNDKAAKIARQLLKEASETECGALQNLCIEASQLINQLISSNELVQKQPGAPKEKSEEVSHALLETYRQDSEMIEYIKTNAKFFSESVVSNNLGISKKYLMLLAKDLGVEFDWADLHPKMREIYPRGLPNGTEYIMDTSTDKYLIPTSSGVVTHVFSMDF